MNSAFDIIQADFNGAKGIIMPLFVRKKLGTEQMVFCVDFGTTNTHIAYAKEGEAPKDLSFGWNNDRQVISLFDEGWPFYKIPRMREFAPVAIGGDGNDDETPKFPIRSTVCVSKDWLNSTNARVCNIFANANIGFYYLNEMETDRAKNAYRTNIKWASDPKSILMKGTYFEEIMWLLKNKAVMDNCSLDFKFYFTYPQSMNNV